MAPDHGSDDHGRVEPAAPVADAPVKMRSCGPSGHAHLSDHLATANNLPLPETLSFQMAVNVLISTGGDDNSDSAGAVIDRFHDPARPPAQNWRSQRSSDIQSGVGLRSAVWSGSTAEMAGVSLKDGDRKNCRFPALVCWKSMNRQQQRERNGGKQMSQGRPSQSRPRACRGPCPLISSTRKAENPTMARRPFQTSELLLQPHSHFSWG